MARLLLFDLNPSGHHAGYLHHLIRYWQPHQPDDELVVLVSPGFLTLHTGIVTDAQRPGVRLISVSEAENNARLTAADGIGLSKAEWNLMVQYATREQADTVLLMYFDHLQPAFFLSKPLPFRVSGILFRPSFHYAEWGYGPQNWRERLQFWRKKWLLKSLLKRPELKTIFCLDPYAVAPMNSWLRHEVACYLPDPVPARSVNSTEIEELRTRLGFQLGRRVLLLFGQLDERKGVVPLLQAFGQLSPDEQAGWSLLLAGPLADSLRPALENNLHHAGMVQVVRQHTFVHEAGIQVYFGLADLVGVLYQQHIGMSAVLVRAAAARRPVLATDYGLLGQLVKQKQLGRGVDAASPTAIADALRAFGRGEWSANQHEIQTFAEQNRAEQFARVILTRLTGQPLDEIATQKL